MKIAITSQGNTLDSDVDPKFGRAKYILIVDTDTLAFNAFDNSENANAFKGAGIQAASLVGNNEATVLLTGYCGPKAFKILDSVDIKVVNDVSGKVKDVVTKFDYRTAVFATGPNREAHS